MHTGQNRKTDEILNSLDGFSRAAAPDLFYTRLKAKMLGQLEKGGEIAIPDQRAWALRPVYAVAALVMVLVVNSFVLLQKNKGGATNSINDTETFQSIAAEYSINDNNGLYDLNQDK